MTYMFTLFIDFTVSFQVSIFSCFQGAAVLRPKNEANFGSEKCLTHGDREFAIREWPPTWDGCERMFLFELEGIL